MRAFLLLTLLFCVACSDSSVFDPRSLDVPANTTPSFTPDPFPTGKAITMSGTTVNDTDLDLWLTAGWTDSLNGPNLRTADLLLRIDPGAQAEVLSVEDGSWCGSELPSVTPNGSPGEWRFVKSAEPDDCTCPASEGWEGPFPDTLGVIRVRIHQPGTWRVSLAEGSATPACECGGNCPSDIVLSGGSVSDR